MDEDNFTSGCSHRSVSDFLSFSKPHGSSTPSILGLQTGGHRMPQISECFSQNVSDHQGHRSQVAQLLGLHNTGQETEEIGPRFTFIMICLLGTIMLTPLNKAFKFSGSSTLPAYPGFMVMNSPTLASKLTLLPSVNKKDFFLSLIALKIQWTCPRESA